MKDLLLNILEATGLAYWIEITTEQPQCTYYFGPFVSREEAVTAQAGYLEDLAAEGAENIRVNLKRCPKPEELTVFDDTLSKKNRMSILSFSH